MTAYRKALRDAAEDALSAALPSWHLALSWAHNLDTDALPMLAVMVSGEQSAAGSSDRLRRDVSLVVVLRREGGDDLDDILDAAAAQVEAAVGPAVAGVGAVLTSELSETRIQIAGEGARRVGQVELRWSCIVFTDLA